MNSLLNNEHFIACAAFIFTSSGPKHAAQALAQHVQS